MTDEELLPIDVTKAHPYWFVVFPSELPHVWVAHAPQINAVAQGDGPAHAVEQLIQVIAVTMELERRAGQDPKKRAFMLPQVKKLVESFDSSP